MNKKLLILDLDETLIHAVEEPLSYACDFSFDRYFVYLRPYLKEFLEFTRTYFEVAVWTSSGSEYASAVVESVFGDDYPLSFVWSRERCVQKFDPEYYEYIYVKDLAKVKKKGYKLDQILVLDDTPKKLMRHFGNLIKIEPFEGDQADRELKLAKSYLESLISVENVRIIEKRGWRNGLV